PRYPHHLQKVELISGARFSDDMYWRRTLSSYISERYFEYKEMAFADTPKFGPKNARGSCYADSGGPLITYDKKNQPLLLGITSRMVQNCGVSTIFTDVAFHL